jgi:hypothetical protein
MTGAVRSLQWTIQDLNSSVEHLGQSHDHLRRAQNMMAWTTAIFGALLLSGLVWIANDIFHLKDQMTDNNRRFDGLDAQMSALGTRLDDLNLTIEQVGAEILAGRNTPPQDAAGPEVSVLSTPNGAAGVQGAAAVPADPAALDATAQTQQQAALAQQAPVAAAPATAAVAPAPAAPATAAPAVAAVDPLLSDVVVPSPPAPRAGLTPEELAQQSPVVTAAAPASEPAPAAATPAAEPAAAASSEVAAAAAAPAASGGQLSDDQLLSYNDDQIDPADELLLLDENGNPQ